MLQHLAHSRGRLVYASILLAGAVATVSPTLSLGRAQAVGPSQTVQAPAYSSKTVVLTHRHAVKVAIKNLAFGPQKIVISPGTKVSWANQDGFQHTVTSDTELWDSGPVNSISTFVRVFKKAGTFTYHCTIHPFMHGTITVKK